MSDVSRFDGFIKKAIAQKKVAHKNVKQAFKEFSEYREQQSAASDSEKKPRKRRTKVKQPKEDLKNERIGIDGDERDTRQSGRSERDAELSSVQRSVSDDESGDRGSDIANTG